MEADLTTLLIYATNEGVWVLIDALHGIPLSMVECQKFGATIMEQYDKLIPEHGPFKFTCLSSLSR